MAPPGAGRLASGAAADISDVVGRPRTAWRKRAVLLGIYLLAVFSKREVMPLVPPELFWHVDFAYFIVLPLLLFLAGWRRPDAAIDGPEAFIKPATDEVKSFVNAIIGVWLFLGLWGVWVAAAALALRLAPDWLAGWQPSFSYRDHLPPLSLWRWATVVYMSLSAALVEEFFFRKALRQVLHRWTPSSAWFVAVSAGVFGLAHWASGYQGVAAATAVGVVLGACYVKLNRLAPLVIAHCLLDLVLFSR